MTHSRTTIFTRAVLEHVTELPAYGRTAARSEERLDLGDTKDFVQERRCPRLFVDFEAELVLREANKNRRDWIQVYSEHRRRVANAVHRHSEAEEILGRRKHSAEGQPNKSFVAVGQRLEVQ